MMMVQLVQVSMTWRHAKLPCQCLGLLLHIEGHSVCDLGARSIGTACYARLVTCHQAHLALQQLGHDG